MEVPFVDGTFSAFVFPAPRPPVFSFFWFTLPVKMGCFAPFLLKPMLPPILTDSIFAARMVSFASPIHSGAEYIPRPEGGSTELGAGWF
jgi:hypothetical protein